MIDEIKSFLKDELQTYYYYEDNIKNVNNFDNGIWEGRKEFAEELWNLINKDEPSNQLITEMINEISSNICIRRRSRSY